MPNRDDLTPTDEPRPQVYAVLCEFERPLDNHYPDGNERAWWAGWVADRLCARRHPAIDNMKNRQRGIFPCAECITATSALLDDIDSIGRPSDA